MSDKPSRRHFFNPKSVSQAIQGQSTDQDSNDPAMEGIAGSSSRSENYVYAVAREAMACQFEVILNGTPSAEHADAAMEALDLVEELEAQMTVYRDTSIIMAINRRGFEEPVSLEPRLYGLLKTAVQLHAFTDGAFDMTAGKLSKVWGFFRREGKIPDERALNEALELVGTSNLIFNDQFNEVGMSKSGVEINLGGIGKGYALDRCAEDLLSADLSNFLLHGGQSSILARGKREGIEKEGGKGWSIGLRHPVWHEKRLAEIFLVDRALGTSGTGRQGFYHKGKRYGHIIDPRNGIPVDGVLSSTVLAPTAGEADALATAFYVLGPERSLELCEKRPDIATIIVTPGDKQGSVNVYTANLEEDDWRRLG